ncbi:YybH family protein [Caulobacter sp. NIBR2454]|uniref:YybH family protein n=1 Tax=Caulobacter sp. NIBR2454 TaxID=3015996 RepID=UPI0022B6A9A2|nr:nuclear transport factor 2 family protein [Caulobacter sp. NIBR2454]
MSPDEADIRALIEARSQAIRDKDADRALATYAGQVVSYDLAPPLAMTGDVEGAREGLTAWFGTWEGAIGYEVRDLAVDRSDHLALAYGFLRIFGLKTDGERPSVWTRMTLGLRKIDGSWRIHHEHVSTPFYMDGSGKAALDLEP